MIYFWEEPSCYNSQETSIWSREKTIEEEKAEIISLE